MGSSGDGIARLPDGTAAYVPFTLPAERVVVRPLRRQGEGWAAVADAIERASPDRVTPPCHHFGTCGGCALQHWGDAPLAVWKARRVAAALARAGLAWTPEPARRVVAASRRRMDLAVRRLPSGVVIGLHGTDPAQVRPIEGCQVLHPDLAALLPDLRDTLDRLAGLRREGSVLLNRLDTGPDLLLVHDADLTPQDRQRLAAFAGRHGVPRVAARRGRDWEIACQLGPAAIAFAGVSVHPPPGAFLQASADAEAAIVAAVLAGLPDRLPSRAKIAELYAGCGTLTFPLARAARVTAFEGDAEAAACLAAAAREAGRVTVVARDLARQPLTATELAGVAAIVLDPPFAGAGPQMPAIAASGVPRVIYVSCNPVALARDAATLAAAGYRLLSASAIDQFAWSPHVESVIIFGR